MIIHWSQFTDDLQFAWMQHKFSHFTSTLYFATRTHCMRSSGLVLINFRTRCWLFSKWRISGLLQLGVFFKGFPKEWRSQFALINVKFQFEGNSYVSKNVAGGYFRVPFLSVYEVTPWKVWHNFSQFALLTISFLRVLFLPVPGHGYNDRRVKGEMKCWLLKLRRSQCLRKRSIRLLGVPKRRFCVTTGSQLLVVSLKYFEL